MSISKNHNGEIDVFKFIFSLVILFGHFSNEFGGAIFGSNGIAVEFFFVVSGYLMASYFYKIKDKTRTNVSSETYKFLSKRIKSFYRYYFFAVLLNFTLRKIIIGWIWLKNISIKDLFGEVISSVPTFSLSFMAINASKTGMYSPATWYLSAMVISFLLLSPLLIKSYEKSVRIYFPIGVLCVLCYLYNTTGLMKDWRELTSIYVYQGLLRGVCEIAFGCVVFELGCHWNNTAINQNIFLKVIFSIAKYGCYFAVLMRTNGLFSSDAMDILFVVAVAILFSFTKTGFMIPSNSVTVFLGKISVPIYIFHAIFRDAIADIIGDKALSTQQILVISLLVLLVSVFLMFVCDYIYKLLKKLFCSIFKEKLFEV